MGLIEWIAAGLGVGCVYLIIRQSIWCWPIGIAMTTLYAWIFFNVRLYSDFGLQLVFTALQMYGWWYWLTHADRATEEARAPILVLGRTSRILWLVAGIAGTAILGTVMSRYTDAALPYWDALTTSFSLVAQALLARKYLENWIVWIGVDIFAIGIYLAKGLAVTAGLYAVFLVMASWGLWQWYRDRQLQLAGEVS